VKASGELQVLIASPTASELTTPIGQEGGWVTQTVWAFWKEEIDFFSGIERLHGQFSVAPQNKRKKFDKEKLLGSSQ